MQWLRLQLKLAPYKLAWFLVVTFSIVYTLRGMQAIFPTEILFTFRGLPITETHILGIGLCLGQYTMLSIAFGLFRSEQKLRVPDKFMAYGGLAIGILLTISNTTFAFKAINMSKDESIVRIETLKAEVSTIDSQMVALNTQIDRYTQQLRLVPSAHSSNIIKMQNQIQGYIDPLQNQLKTLENEKYSKNAEMAKLQGQSETNRNFSLDGMDGSRLIAMVMSVALDPIAIMIMLSMQSLTAQYWKEIRDLDKARLGSPIKLNNVKRIVRQSESAIKKALKSAPEQKPEPPPQQSSLTVVRPIRQVDVVDHTPAELEDEVDTVELSIPKRG